MYFVHWTSKNAYINITKSLINTSICMVQIHQRKVYFWIRQNIFLLENYKIANYIYKIF